MPVTARLSKLFYDRLGETITQELVDWLNAVDATYRADLRELNELNFARFDAKLEQRVAALEAKLEQRVAALEAKLEQRVAALDAKLERCVRELEAKLDSRINQIEVNVHKLAADLNAKIDRVAGELNARIDVVSSELQATLEKGLRKQTRWLIVSWLTLVGLFVPILAIWLRDG